MLALPLLLSTQLFNQVTLMPTTLTSTLKNHLIELGIEIQLPVGSIIGDSCQFEPPCGIKMMQIECNLSMGAFSYGVDGFFSGVQIGRYCSIAGQAQIGRGNHPMDWVSTSPFQYLSPFLDVGKQFSSSKEYHSYTPPEIPNDIFSTGYPTNITIGNDVWIGHGAFIKPGITIGDGAIIGAMAVVTKNVAPYHIVAGNPARVIKQRFSDEIIAELMALKWWRFAPWQLGDIPFHHINTAIEHLKETIPTLQPYQPTLIKELTLETTPKNNITNHHTTPITMNSILSLWTNATEATTNLDFNLGPAIPFIQLGRFLDLAAEINIDINGKQCMDYGCGQSRSFSIAALLYLFGAKSVVSIDIEPHFDEVSLAQGLWSLLAVLAIDSSAFKINPAYQDKIIKTRIFDFDLNALKQGRLYDGLPPEIKHYTGNYHHLAKKIGDLDIIVSNSVFEHDPEIEITLQIFKQYLRPDGCIYTDIDYRDHRHYLNGLSSWQYLIDNDDVSPDYINKIRSTEMRNIIRRSGFDIVKTTQLSEAPPQNIIDQLLPQYQNLQNNDLNIVQDSLILK